MLVAALALVCVLGATAPVAAASDPAAPAVAAANGADDTAVVVADETVRSDGTASHRVALSEAPNGLAGFELTLTLETAGVATVTDASYPDRFAMTTDPVVSADGRTITVEAVDLDDEITAGARDVTLANIEVAADGTGDAELAVTDARIDADGGDRVDPSHESGTVTVVDGDTSSPGTPNDRESGDEDPAEDDAVPGFTVTGALAAIAVLALVRLR